jgi:hypothetical protein
MADLTSDVHGRKNGTAPLILDRYKGWFVNVQWLVPPQIVNEQRTYGMREGVQFQ